MVQRRSGRRFASFLQWKIIVSPQGGDGVKSIEIRLKTHMDALILATRLTRYSYKIDMQIGCTIIDAKSILGVLGLGVGKSVCLNINTDDEGALFDDIACFIV